MNGGKAVYFDSEKYFSLREASGYTDYHRDYLGQPCRSEQIVCRQIGNQWFVQEKSLNSYKSRKSENENNFAIFKNRGLEIKKTKKIELVSIKSEEWTPVFQKVLAVFGIKIQDTRYKIQDNRWEEALFGGIQDTKYQIQDTKYKLPNFKFISGVAVLLIVGFLVFQNPQGAFAKFSDAKKIIERATIIMTDAVDEAGENVKIVSRFFENKISAVISSSGASVAEIKPEQDFVSKAINIFKNVGLGTKEFVFSFFQDAGDGVKTIGGGIKDAFKSSLVKISQNFKTGEETKKIPEEKTIKSEAVSPQSVEVRDELADLRREIGILKTSGLRVEKIIEKPTVIERTIQQFVSEITKQDLETQLNQVNNKILSQYAELKNLIAERTQANFNAIALSQRINTLSNVTISSPTISSGTISNASSISGETLSLSRTATISGNTTLSADLNVDGGTLYVDSSNNRVGVGTTSPQYALDVDGAMRVTSLVAGEQTIGGNLGVSGNLTVDGNSTLGNATSTDIVYLNSRLAGALVPTSDNLLDLGDGANWLRWRTGYFGTSVGIAGTATSTGSQLTASGAYLLDSGGVLSINTSNNQNVIFGTGRIGMGTSTPLVKLNIYGGDVAFQTSSNSASAFQILNSATSSVFSVNTVSGTTTLSAFDVTGAGTSTIANNLQVQGTLQIGTGSSYLTTSLLNIGSGGALQIGGTQVLSATTLGSGVLGSSLTSLGTIATGVWQGTVVGVGYGGTGISSYTPGDILYASGATTLSRVASSTGGTILQTSFTTGAPSWTATSSLKVALSDTTGTLAVARGGTGLTTFGGVNTILYTTAADALSSITTANSGVLVTGATGIPSIATDIPTAVTIGGQYVYRVGGTDVAVADGGTGLSSYTINNLLYASGATTIAGLATANSGVLVTGATGIPSIATDIPTAVTIGGQYVYRVGGTDVDVADGGTGLSSYTPGDILYASGATTLSRVASSTGGTILQTSFTTGAPSWAATSSLKVALSDTTGTLAVARGGTGLTTFGGTNTILYTTAADALSSITTANSGVLVTGATGIPSIATDIPTAVTIGGQYVYRVGGTDVAVADGGTGVGSWTNGQLLIGNTTGNTAALGTITGTANQITVVNGASSITLSTPQSIATASTPQFARLGLGGAAHATDILTITSTDTTADSKALNIAHSGAITGTGYGLYVSKTGGSTTNVGGYFSASGATNNYGLIVENGSVGVGTTSPWARFAVNPVAGDTNQFVVGSSTATSFVITPGGNVGIGTTGPQQSLHVAGTGLLVTGTASAAVANSAAFDYSSGTRILSRGANTTTRGPFDVNIQASDGTLNLIPISVQADGDVILAQSAGNVGIGTTGPNVKFQVADSGASLNSASLAGFNVVSQAAGWSGVFISTDDNSATNKYFLAMRSDQNNNGEGLNDRFYFRTDGVGLSDGGWTTPADYAEYFETNDTDLDKGELVSIDPNNSKFVRRASGINDPYLLGVISTKPGIIGVAADDVTDATAERENNPRWKIVGLLGQIPVKVSLENGPINIGDPLTSSSQPGVGMKAAKSGMAIGVALEPLNSSSQYEQGKNYGKILVFINFGYYHLDEQIASGQVSNVNGQMFVIDQSTGRIKASYGLDLSGNDLVNVSRIISASGLWSIDEFGKLAVQEIETQKLKVKSPSGFTIYDEDTGQPVCVKSKSGALVTVSGECAPPAANPPAENPPPPPADTEPPVITIHGNNPAEIAVGTSYGDLGASAQDNIDGDISLLIKTYVNGLEMNPVQVDTSTTTTHTIDYAVSDQAGNSATSTRQVIVY